MCTSDCVLVCLILIVRVYFHRLILHSIGNHIIIFLEMLMYLKSGDFTN